MKFIGFSSGVTGHISNVDRIVSAILNQSGGDSEFVKLTDLSYSGCKGCVQLCAKPQVCLLEDDLLPYYQKIKEADAVVIGSPVYIGDVNANMAAFIERLIGFRHVTFAIRHIPFILVVCAEGLQEGITTTMAERLRKKLRPFGVEVLHTVEYVSETPCCFSCGRHRECSIGGHYLMWGDSARSLKITPESFHRWEDDPETVKSVENAAAKLRHI